MIKKIKEYLKELDFSSNEIKVYISLTKLGESPATSIAKKADLPRTTVISILERFKEDGYLTTHKFKGVAYYWIESPEVICERYSDKLSTAEELKDLLRDFYRIESKFPSAQIFDTKKTIRMFMENSLFSLKNASVLLTIDSPGMGNYNKVYSENINKNILNIKNKKNLITYTLVPFANFSSISKEKLKNQKIIIKEMPAGINFTSSVWIVDDVLVHFSGNPPFVVSVKHKEIVKSTKSFWDYLWSISEEKFNNVK